MRTPPARVRNVYVEIPAEDWEDGDQDRCGTLLKSLYGTRGAVVNWSVAYSKVFAAHGVSNGASSPCTFRCNERGVNNAVHGAGFITEGCEVDPLRLPEGLKNEFEIKVELLCAASRLCKSISLLNRVVEWKAEGISCEPAPRQLGLIIRGLQFVNAKNAVTPGVRAHNKRRNTNEFESTAMGQRRGLRQRRECQGRMRGHCEIRRR